MAQITPMFAVPFGFAQMPASEALNEALRALFLAREQEGTRWANPNPYTIRNSALFESHFDLFDWPEEPVQRLAQFCLGELMQLVGQLSGYDLVALRKLEVQTDAWFHITRRGGHFGMHNHPMASWSGVYCVSPGRHDADATDSGRLSFVNPNSLAGMYLDPANSRLRQPFAFSNHGFDLAAGQLILFPSWVQHYVLPFQGEGERITVAFNCMFR
ncbi:putative 2OG-Fe(II) oxygenase [Silanimonas lenta]|uniref:putative 2OG-Fe(II) oxygenase n=1 Tax=Silanimonas lenta TaxID=265429 RepID=UPI000428C20D|nr:putative 2OG-Fe(II) oxygenase [Silanimonas lenta]